MCGWVHCGEKSCEGDCQVTNKTLWNSSELGRPGSQQIHFQYKTKKNHTAHDTEKFQSAKIVDRNEYS